MQLRPHQEPAMLVFIISLIKRTMKTIKYLVLIIVIFSSCKKLEIKPLEIDKGKADSIYASKIINPKLK